MCGWCDVERVIGPMLHFSLSQRVILFLCGYLFMLVLQVWLMEETTKGKD